MFSQAIVNNTLDSTNKVFKPEVIDITNEMMPLNQQGCSMQAMVSFYLDALNIKGVSLHFIKRRMPNPDTLGYMKPIREHHYLIALAKALEPSELRITVAHELVHVRQFETGAINRSEFQKDYMARNFEDEAFRLSLPLAARFFQEASCQQNNEVS